MKKGGRALSLCFLALQGPQGDHQRLKIHSTALTWSGSALHRTVSESERKKRGKRGELPCARLFPINLFFLLLSSLFLSFLLFLFSLRIALFSPLCPSASSLPLLLKTPTTVVLLLSPFSLFPSFVPSLCCPLPLPLPLSLVSASTPSSPLLPRVSLTHASSTFASAAALLIRKPLSQAPARKGGRGCSSLGDQTSFSLSSSLPLFLVRFLSCRHRRPSAATAAGHTLHSTRAEPFSIKSKRLPDRPLAPFVFVCRLFVFPLRFSLSLTHSCFSKKTPLRLPLATAAPLPTLLGALRLPALALVCLC